MPLPLSAWESFYVITGSSGAALTGLMFVVIALAADRTERATTDGLNAFSTPTVAHFSIVLLLAGIMTMPLHGVTSLRLCIAAVAIAGLTSASIAVRRMRRLSLYAAETEDWAWYAILPFIAYLVLLLAALLLGRWPPVGLATVAIVALSLLFIGIHNAWDVAVYLVVSGMRPAAAPDASGTPEPAVRAATAPPPAQQAPAADPAPPARRD